MIRLPQRQPQRHPKIANLVKSLNIIDIDEYAGGVADCKAQCLSLAGAIYVNSGHRPHMYSNDAFHYHLRLPPIHKPVYIDPTIQQFFAVPNTFKLEVFFGLENDLINHLTYLYKNYRFNEAHLYIRRINPKSLDDLTHLWFDVKLNRSGDTLTRTTLNRPGGRIRGYYR